jgi:hypothetical protein
MPSGCHHSPLSPINATETFALVPAPRFVPVRNIISYLGTGDEKRIGRGEKKKPVWPTWAVGAHFRRI